MKLELQFFGTGGQKSKYIGSNRYANELIFTSNGSIIEFDGKLEYGAKDNTISDETRKKLIKLEKSISKYEIEHGYVITRDGDIVEQEFIGDKTTAEFTYSALNTENGILIHNHPRGRGGLGGTFSLDDILLLRFKIGTIRAITQEGTYSLSKLSDYNHDGLVELSLTLTRKYNENYEIIKEKYQKAVDSGIMSVKVANRKFSREMNTELLKVHKAYIDGQSLYGYKYTLEKKHTRR